METSFLQRKLFWGIRVWEICSFIGLHLFLALLYFATLLLTVSQNQMDGIAINHSLKILFTAPFWWLFFRKLRHWSLLSKVFLHLPSCALYVFIWLQAYQASVDALGLGRLWGAGIWWDVYIPVLIYFIQFAIFHVYDFWQQMLRQQAKEKELTKLAHAAELHTLKAQIQPHFLFNTLHSISSTVPSAQEHTRTLIVQLADVFRFAMNVTDKEFITLQQEVQFIKDFLALEQQRFGDRLQVHFDIDENLGAYPVPPMLLQPLVENALKHGIARSIEGGSLTLSIRQRNDRLQFTIADTGAGINGYSADELFGKGIGLQNTRRRLHQLYGSNLSITQQLPRGTEVQFSIPLTSSTTGTWN